MVEVHDILERNSVIIYDEYAPLRTFLRDPVKHCYGSPHASFLGCMLIVLPKIIALPSHQVK